MYKFSGASSLWAALGQGDSSLKWLERSLEILPRFGVPPAPARIPTVTPNTFYSERENPTFESPISTSRSMLDMLLQDWNGVIRVFPAMPTTWKEASFYQLKTQGAFLVSAVRKIGHTQFIHIKSLAGAPCIIQTDFSNDLKLIGPKTVNMFVKDGRIQIQLKKGEEAVLYRGEKPASFAISQIAVNTAGMNSWGVRLK